jgi:hypothetical protein
MTRLAGAPSMIAVRIRMPGVGLYVILVPIEVSGKMDGPPMPLCENSGPVPKELFKKRPLDARR